MPYRSEILSKPLRSFIFKYTPNPLLDVLCKKFPDNTITKMSENFIYHDNPLSPELLVYIDGFSAALNINIFDDEVDLDFTVDDSDFSYEFFKL